MYFIRILLLLVTAGAIFTSCGKQAPETRPDAYLKPEEQSEFIYSIIRYHGRLAPKSDHLSKFRPEFDEEYRKIAAQYELIAYYPIPDSDTICFMTYRVAPSLTLKKVATAGKVVFNETGEATHYEEIFRTWKMVPDELDIKAGMLLAKTLNHEDLSPYYPQHSGEDEFIEFPDPYTRFDTKLKRWVSERENPLEDLYQQEKDRIQ